MPEKVILMSAFIWFSWLSIYVFFQIHNMNTYMCIEHNQKITTVELFRQRIDKIKMRESRRKYVSLQTHEIGLSCHRLVMKKESMSCISERAGVWRMIAEYWLQDVSTSPHFINCYQYWKKSFYSHLKVTDKVTTKRVFAGL